MNILQGGCATSVGNITINMSHSGVCFADCPLCGMGLAKNSTTQRQLRRTVQILGPRIAIWGRIFFFFSGWFYSSGIIVKGGADTQQEWPSGIKEAKKASWKSGRWGEESAQGSSLTQQLEEAWAWAGVLESGRLGYKPSSIASYLGSWSQSHDLTVESLRASASPFAKQGDEIVT